MPKFSDPVYKGLYAAFTDNDAFTEAKLPEDLNLLVLNISEGCNLACTYCFADRGQYGAKHARWMDSKTAIQALKYVNSNYRRLNAIKFFGGEPFIKFDVMKDVYSYLADTCEPDGIPNLVAITNLTRLTDEMIDWINMTGIELTVSYDGDPEINDLNRIFPSGKGSSDKILKNFERLGDAMQNVVIEVVYGPAHFLAGKSMSDVSKALKSKFNPKAVLIHPMLETKFGSFEYSKAQWEEYYSSVREGIQTCAKDDMISAYQNTNAEQFEYFMSSFIETEHVDSHCGLGIDTITVQANGNITPCYTLIGKSEFDMGTVNETVQPAEFSAVSQKFVENKKSTNPHCKDCDVIKTCHACPGGMLDAEGALEKPIASMCENMIGTVQGRLDAIAEIYKQDSFDNLSNMTV